MLSLTVQELRPYAAPLLAGAVILGIAVQQLMRAYKIQRQLADSEEALLAAREELHEQDIELQVLGSQQQQLQVQLERREADYQQLKVEHSTAHAQLLQVRGVADAARAAYRELKEQQVQRDSALAEQQARYLELQQAHQQLQQDHTALSGLSAQKEQHLLEQQCSLVLV